MSYTERKSRKTSLVWGSLWLAPMMLIKPSTQGEGLYGTDQQGGGGGPPRQGRMALISRGAVVDRQDKGMALISRGAVVDRQDKAAWP